jgi:mRNA interferase MazF
MPRRYVPQRGDIVWLSGRRPALVLSPAAYNAKVGLGLFCPITSRVKGYPFEVTIPPGPGVSGVVLADQVRSLDWRARRAELAGRLPATHVLEVLDKLDALLSEDDA